MKKVVVKVIARPFLHGQPCTRWWEIWSLITCGLNLSCEEADDTKVNKWLVTNTEDHEISMDHEIVSLLTQESNDNSDEKEEADDSRQANSHF